MGYKIVVYAICKNEERFIERWVNSMKEADLIVVTDTGSTDKSVEKLKNLGVVVYEEKIEPFRFDVARNLSLSRVPKDTDIYVCTDIDDVFCKNWRKKVEKAWSRQRTKLYYTYNWSFKEDGSPGSVLRICKIHNKDYEWKYPIHEWIFYKGKEKENSLYAEGLVLNHKSLYKETRANYIKLLEMAVEEMPKEDRMWYYLGREYFYYEMWEKCINALKIYTNLPTSNWKEERSSAMRMIAGSYDALQEIKEAYKWYIKAHNECRNMRESFMEMSRTAYSRKDWAIIHFAANGALKIKEKSSCFINNVKSWNYTLDDLLSIGYYNLEIYDKSLLHVDKAIKSAPYMLRLKDNKNFIENKFKGQKNI